MQSIQRVLSVIQIEQVCCYLTSAGWTQRINGARVDFELHDPSQGETYRVFVPASTRHPRYRHLLPNLVFAVSVVEGREPIEIASDMAKTPTQDLSSENLTGWLIAAVPALAPPAVAVDSPSAAAAHELYAQFCFAIGGLEPHSAEPAPWLRAVAVLICGISHLLPDEPAAHLQLFQLASRGLSLAQLSLADAPEFQQQLWEVSRADSRQAPVNTLAWLTNTTQG